MIRSHACESAIASAPDCSPQGAFCRTFVLKGGSDSLDSEQGDSTTLFGKISLRSQGVNSHGKDSVCSL